MLKREITIERTSTLGDESHPPAPADWVFDGSPSFASGGSVIMLSAIMNVYTYVCLI